MPASGSFWFSTLLRISIGATEVSLALGTSAASPCWDLVTDLSRRHRDLSQTMATGLVVPVCGLETRAVAAFGAFLQLARLVVPVPGEC